MFDFKTWMLGVAGGALIISLVEIIAPFGKMNSFCKGVFGIYYIYIVISPIISVVKNYF